MRKILFIYTAAIAVILSSCGGSDAKLKEMQAKLDSLEQINGGNTENINSYIAEMNTIYDRLDEIKRNEGVISDNSVANEGDLSDDKRERSRRALIPSSN